MISVSSYPCINTYNKNRISQVFSGSDISSYLDQGDNALNTGKYQEALQAYKSALGKSPDDLSIVKKIAKAYFYLKDYSSAEEKFKLYLDKNDKDTEAWIAFGENQRQRGLYKEAKQCFEKALYLDDKNDLAKRSLLETENNMLSCYSQQSAQEEKEKYADNNLRQALKMAVDYLSPEYMRDLANTQIKFGTTASMAGTPNIAQYENSKQTITISSMYKYASPQVIAAYLVHESVHAKDNDPYTSVREEQDAYEIATKFWIKNSNGIKDPEMDYAASLYKKSPDALRDRVAEIYKMRDPDIAATSPNHPSTKKFYFSLYKSKAANQPIREYSAIA